MPAIHTTLAAGRWQELTLAEQLGNIGSEISRARSADERGNVERRNLSLERVLELVQLTITNESRQWRRLELQNLQAENLIKLASKEKTIIMGDFNALPESTVIQKMNQTLQDSEIDSITPTWSVYKEGCTVCLVGDIKHKLDYIFTSKDIKASSFKVHESKSSDHLPISAVIKL